MVLRMGEVRRRSSGPGNDDRPDLLSREERTQRQTPPADTSDKMYNSIALRETEKEKVEKYFQGLVAKG